VNIPLRLVPKDPTQRIRRKGRYQRGIKHAVDEAALVVAYGVVCGHAARACDAWRQPERDGRAADGADNQPDGRVRRSQNRLTRVVADGAEAPNCPVGARRERVPLRLGRAAGHGRGRPSRARRPVPGGRLGEGRLEARERDLARERARGLHFGRSIKATKASPVHALQRHLHVALATAQQHEAEPHDRRRRRAASRRCDRRRCPAGAARREHGLPAARRVRGRVARGRAVERERDGRARVGDAPHARPRASRLQDNRRAVVRLTRRRWRW
jgi:hypothetical protein